MPAALKVMTLVVLVALVAAGGFLGFSSFRSPSVVSIAHSNSTAPGDFLYSDSSTTLFVQWTRTGSVVSGTLDVAYLQPNATKVTNESQPFTGTLAGGDVTLVVGQSFLGATNISGTFDGSTLTLSIPNSDGSLAQIVLRPASLSGYNHDIAALKGVAQQNLAAQQQAQRQQAVAAAQAAARQQVDKAIAAVQSDLQGLSQDSNFSNVLAGVASDLVQTNTDLASTQKAAQADEAEAQQYPSGNYGQVCADAGGVSADAGGVSADAGGVESSANSVVSYVNTVNSDIASLRNDFAALGTAEGNIPTYHPTGVIPTTKLVNAAIAHAQQAIAQAVTTANNEIDQANSDVAAAFNAADQAAKDGHCGSGPAAPQPEGHIS